ncbi:guanylate kinase [Clostridium tepidiprofundi DSM 19306]|uniref:Guanylate kinase n=1 Tax=Clostridium tepidiprofundi DSM 19306 TaxID=1121338 RepID=A0A151B2F8_9CLOT|nr:hypothetical protein [Clostridium tepidiprofundi]KYH33973.1 guanylate kinase [Clostridium tepidiprofundi DSM 19306]
MGEELIIISGPSGGGKTAIVEELVRKNSGVFERVVTTTTRKRRKNEDEYIYLSKEEFERLIEEDAFLEHNKFMDNMYGVLKESIETIMEKNKVPILIVDVNGYQKVIKHYESKAIFLIPGTARQQYNQIKQRNKNCNDDEIINRMNISLHELKYINLYDYIVENQVLEEAYKEVEQIIYKGTREKDIYCENELLIEKYKNSLEKFLMECCLA